MTSSVILFGKGVLASTTLNLLVDSGFDIIMVVPSSKESTWGSQIDLADEASTLGIKVGTLSDVEKFGMKDINLGISVFFDRIFRPIHIQKFSRLVNLHNSPLPKYRGVLPINHALKNGEVFHGVTIHEIDSGIDTGPILAQSIFPINPTEDEVIDVYQRCLLDGEKLIRNNLPNLLSMDSKPQDHSQSSTYSRSDDSTLGDRKFWTRKSNM